MKHQSVKTRRANKNLRFLERQVARSAALLVTVVSLCVGFDKFGYKGLLLLLIFAGFSAFVLTVSKNSPEGSR